MLTLCEIEIVFACAKLGTTMLVCFGWLYSCEGNSPSNSQDVLCCLGVFGGFPIVKRAHLLHCFNSSK